MPDVFFYNSLSRKREKFEPIEPGKVRLYTCGPTVYYYPQIGNWRTFVFEDVLRRVLEYNSYEVRQVMNATDVGHLTGDNVGNADVGEDRIEQEAKKEGKSAWDIADFYIQDFRESLKLLNIEPATSFVRATDNIPEQIRLVETLMTKGLAYVTETGVFFDVTKFPDYGKLGGQRLVDKRALSRDELVEDKTKRQAADFALWKFSVTQVKRQMEWESPWGVGFPGWHLECSAMAMKYLGETLDIHTGGVDHIAIHHTNEIAQSEGVTGKLFARYWLHGEFLLIDGGRMGKSLGNAYSLHDIIKKGYDPRALRYFYLNAHYRTKMNFTFSALQAAQNALNKLYDLVGNAEEGKIGCGEFEESFLSAVNDDLDMPKSLRIVWDLVKSDYPLSAKKASLLKFDRVLGLGLKDHVSQTLVISDKVSNLLKAREVAREVSDFGLSDKIREEIESLGFMVEDSSHGTKLRQR